MSPLSMPYPEYSWSLSQHMRRSVNDQRIIFSLLKGAAMFGNDPDYATQITQYVIQQGLIPPNIRDNRPQIWRDYQQVLVELGLIYSTRYTTRQVIVTPIGLAWLDGLIGTKEMLTTQALGYQYPNAYKLSLPNAIREQFDDDVLSDRVSLDVRYGVLIKPAILILRILLELLRNGQDATLTSKECVLALMPIKKNEDWINGYGELMLMRSNSNSISAPARSNRHAQEWFALLGATDIFSEAGDRITLSSTALENVDLVERLCEYHEDVNNFWYPDLTRNVDDWVMSWFSYFGTPDLEKQWSQPEPSLTPEYVETNYIEGVEESDEELPPARDVQNWLGAINTSPYVPSEETYLQATNEGRYLTPQEAERYARGIERRQKSTRLHEYIIALLARKLQEQEYFVEDDKQSIDLLAIKDNTETILEIKTVNSKNLFPRMRLGVGQLSEYRYRRQIQRGNRPAGILVLSNSVKPPSWLVDYFNNDIEIGLIGLAPEDRFLAHTDGILESILAI